MAHKIYISPERRPNPHGKYWGMDAYEHDVCCEIASLLAPILRRCGFEVKVADPGPTVYQRVPESISWGADYYLPIHTNASTNGTKEGTAQGPVVLAYGKKGGASWTACQMTYDRLMEIYPYKTNRGVRGDPGFYEIGQTPMLSVYPEIAFHDNGKDAAWIVDNKDRIARALALGVCDWFKVPFVENDNPATGVPEGFIRKAEYDALNARWGEKYNSLESRHKALVDEIRGIANRYEET